MSGTSCLAPYRDPSYPFKASLDCEEGLTETVGGHADTFGLTDLKETLKVLDGSSGICWLTELLLLCLECQAFMNMGNQHGTKHHSNEESGGNSPKSPRITIPRKRRRRTEGIGFTGSLQHNLKMIPRTVGMPLNTRKTRRRAKLQLSNSPSCSIEENSLIIVTPTARRKMVIVKEREEKSASLLEERNRTIKESAVWGEKLPDALSAGVLPRRKELSENKENLLVDSDTDLSEYDNETYLTYSQCSLEPTRTPEDRTRLIPPAARQNHEEKEVKGVENKSSQGRFEGTGKQAAAQRVMSKIEEVEGIIRRVSLTSSDWINEGEAQFNLKQSASVDISLHSWIENFTEATETFGEQKTCSEVKCSSSPSVSALSRALNVPLRESSSFKGKPAILPRLFETSLCSQCSYSPNLPEEHQPDISESHTAWIHEGSLFPWEAGSCEGVPGFSSGTSTDEGKARVNLNEQNQPFQDYLLSSGNDVTIIAIAYTSHTHSHTKGKNCYAPQPTRALNRVQCLAKEHYDI